MASYVINSKGERENFSFQKVFRSAKRAGADNNLAKEIAQKIEKEVSPGTKTSEIFKRIKQLLSKKNLRSAIRFSLKEGMRKLGPTGFPFEKFIREVLIENGFRVKINQYLFGKCGVRYEIDFLAEKEKTLYIGECKYHHLPGERVDLQVVLGNYARFLDLKESPHFKKLILENFEIKSMLVTNTKFTSEAIKYAQCRKTELLGWRYPKNQGLECLIEKEKLYPITTLPSFKNYLKDIFSQNKIMLAKDLLKLNYEVLQKRLNIPKRTLLLLIEEAKILLGK